MQPITPHNKTKLRKKNHLMRAGWLDEAGPYTYELEMTSLGKIKSVWSTQAAKQKLNIFGPPLDNL